MADEEQGPVNQWEMYAARAFLRLTYIQKHLIEAGVVPDPETEIKVARLMIEEERLDQLRESVSNTKRTVEEENRSKEATLRSKLPSTVRCHCGHTTIVGGVEQGEELLAFACAGVHRRPTPAGDVGVICGARWRWATEGWHCAEDSD